MAISNIKKARMKKLERIRKAGFDPYPIKTKRTHSIEEALASFDRFCRARTKLFLVGRIISLREHGGSTFFHFEDGTGKMQAYLKKDKVGPKDYKFFLENFDIGDFVELSGKLFKTKRGEETLEVGRFRILAKSLLPLPEKWHGLQDVEERFRKRYLDLIMNSEVREKFRLRSRIVEEIRNILDDQGFLEVETPVLQPIPGGALAKPFKTHLNALNLDLYLRVSPELYLKRLLVGGFEKVYEIGRCFRNEGMDKHHNPDFTMLEFYWAYQDRDGLMKFVEKIMIDLVKRIKGTDQITYEGKKISFKTPWKRVKFSKVDFEKDKAKMIQPTFVVDHPAKLAILAKAKKEDKKTADRFQLIVGGIELINGFSELNDPIEQEKRFKTAKIETERKDKDFLEALQYGMPPAAGLGMGIDRLVALLTDSHSLRESILFPTMRPRKIKNAK
ncbi:MAG: lysine--tRNA ligase [Candidatus Nealsonbacteria bacterium]|nr:MAG: lysine--tRNA ligase [Candidatus Nealsonbacteria bacterium]